MAKRIISPHGRTVTCKCVDEIKKTVPDLAMTPQQIAELSARGVPVSTNGMQFLKEGSSPNDWSVEPMFKRGADINQLWEMEQTAQEKVLSARRKDILKHR